ncbi:MAG: glycosyltransferase [Bacteroidota bacterium]
MPAFSIILPNYNHAAFLSERIESILHQSFEDFEVIILDDKSSDHSREIIETYRTHPKISRIIYNETNSGSAFFQWKKGIELATGEWIWIAESDDMADPRFLEEAVKTVEQFPSAGLYYCDGIIIDENDKPVNTFSAMKNNIFKTEKWSKPYFQKGIAELNEYLKFDCTINNASGMVFKKEVLRNIPEKLELFRYYGDWYFYLQLTLVTDICYSNKPLNIYRKHGMSLLNAPISSLISRKEYFLVLQLLYYSEQVTGKKELLNHFCYHFLTLGLFSHSPRNSYGIVKSYFHIDRKLACKVIPGLIWMKIFRKFYKTKVMQIEYMGHPV